MLLMQWHWAEWAAETQQGGGGRVNCKPTLSLNGAVCHCRLQLLGLAQLWVNLLDKKGAPSSRPGEGEEGHVDTFCGLVLVFEHTQAELPPVDSVFVQAVLSSKLTA